MKDRGRLRGAFLRRLPIELVVEDGFDGAVGLGADLYGALRRRLEALKAVRPCETDDAEAGAVALLGMRPRLQNLLAERRRRRTDLAGVLADALDCPARVASMARRHVLRDRRVLVVAAHPQMHGDALALAENLDAADSQPRFDLGAGEAIGDAVIVRADLDVIIDADAAQGHSLYS